MGVCHKHERTHEKWTNVDIETKNSAPKRTWPHHTKGTSGDVQVTYEQDRNKGEEDQKKCSFITMPKRPILVVRGDTRGIYLEKESVEILAP